MDTIVLSHALYKPGMDALKGNVEVVIPDNGDSDEILEQLKQVDGFILRIGKIDRKAIEACPKLRVITRPGVGVDNVDVQAATEHGIPVVVCPAVNFHAVAEHTLTLMLALSKNLLESAEETRKGNFAIRNKYAAFEFAGKTLTLLGFGKIGREVARLCCALEMKICVYDPYVKREDIEGLSYDYESDLMRAIGQGDFVSLHMPSTPQTRGMIGTEQLAAFKSSAFFINCARGDVVDEDALIDALESHVIAGAGLDVLKDEPMRADNPLFKMDNVIITPHMAAQTRETTERTVLAAVEGTLAVLRGEKWESVCNPEVYQHARWQRA
ncbi:D-isomer specific 2-hydroxyacid dehydrogenase NAD-binding protein [Coriobacterium glomerans PW2]|uniref:D-isomer specific 2-hydroxyacid dehydrogenase NAD-binding protein n=1 Tax=Coriobacterium glomerans (strain ATCC 49209 / DSM 20642 / JCM 10262 / PW2) TaxID=700015 RepID=F2NA56_CORGP|nr:hydroxyacid dehydrogenase [Coriobacterium glomerans]AEB06450.1 D-isomer specific 2-hydroxyacid dehydrogenase NAD-binding protein [Coriobacterium glomerans PW2]